MILQRIAVSLTVCTTMSACAIVEPYELGDSTGFRDKPSMPNAIAFAESTRYYYYTAISQNTLLNRAAGVALIGAGTAASFLGIRGGRTGQVTALSTAGAGLFAVNSFLYDQPRLGVYVAGVRAIGCSLGQVAPVRALSGEEFEADFKRLREQHRAVSKLLRSGKEFSAPVEADAEKTIAKSGKFISDIKLAGVRLYENVQLIHANVSTALLASEPDLAALLSSLSDTLALGQTTIAAIGKLDLTGEQGSGQALLYDTANDRELKNETAKLKELLERFRDVLSEEELRIGTAGLAQCADFAKVLPFNVLPQPALTLAKGAEGKVLVTGGRKPYSANWVGKLPAPEKIVSLPRKVGPRLCFI